MTEATTQQDEHDELSSALVRLLDAFGNTDGSQATWDSLCTEAGLNRYGVDRAIRQSRRRPQARGGQVVVLPHGGKRPTEILLTNDREPIARQRLRHMRISYAYALHVYWSEHQQLDYMTDSGAPQNDLFEMNYELRKSQETLASQEAKIVSLARTLGLADRKIASFFRVAVSPNEPETVHSLV